MANKLDAEKLRALDEATKPSGIGSTVREFAAEIVRRSKAAEELADCLVSSLPAILAMADEIERLRTALERIALSGDGEGVFERSTLYGTFQNIARQALKEHPRNAD